MGLAGWARRCPDFQSAAMVNLTGDPLRGARRRGTAGLRPPLYSAPFPKEGVSRGQAGSALHGRGQALGRKDRQRRARPSPRAARLRPRRSLDLRPAQERARFLPHPRGLYGGRGDRRRPLRLLSLDRPQSEAALRADGGVPVRHRPGRPGCAVRRRRPARAQRRSRPTETCRSSRPACSSAISASPTRRARR